MRPLLRDDPPAHRRALLIVRATIVLYLLELLLNLTRPRVLPDEPSLSIFERPAGLTGSMGRLLAMPRLVFWAVLAGIAVGTLIQVYALVTRVEGRRAAVLTGAIGAAMLGPFALLALAVIGNHPLTALACVPGTALVLLALHHAQRFGRLPPAVLLAAFAWGALLVFSLGRAFSGLALGTMYGHLAPDPFGATADPGAAGDRVGDLFRLLDLMVYHLKVVDTLAIAAGVVLLLLVFRHRVVDAVSGLVMGAAVGLGYAFVESVLFIEVFDLLTGFNGTTAGFEYFVRQSIGLLGGPVLFGALMGAGVTLAARYGRRGPTVAAAFAAAAGGAIAHEMISGWLSGSVRDSVTVGSTLDTLVVSPALWLLPQVPFLVPAALLVIAGTRARAAAAREAVEARATLGGAITPEETAVLGSAALQFWTLVGTWRRHGAGTARTLYRLQNAQLELAAADPDDHAEAERVRAAVLRLKAQLGAERTAVP